MPSISRAAHIGQMQRGGRGQRAGRNCEPCLFDDAREEVEADEIEHRRAEPQHAPEHAGKHECQHQLQPQRPGRIEIIVVRRDPFARAVGGADQAMGDEEPGRAKEEQREGRHHGFAQPAGLGHRADPFAPAVIAAERGQHQRRARGPQQHRAPSHAARALDRNQRHKEQDQRQRCKDRGLGRGPDMGIGRAVERIKRQPLYEPDAQPHHAQLARNSAFVRHDHPHPGLGGDHSAKCDGSVSYPVVWARVACATVWSGAGPTARPSSNAAAKAVATNFATIFPRSSLMDGK